MLKILKSDKKIKGRFLFKKYKNLFPIEKSICKSFGNYSKFKKAILKWELEMDKIILEIFVNGFEINYINYDPKSRNN